MKKILFVAAGVSVMALASQANAQAVRGAKISGQYICVMKKNVSRSDVRGQAEAAARPLGGTVERVFTRSLRGFTVRIPDALAARLKDSSSSISFCEQDQIITLVPPREDGRYAAARRRPGSGTTSGEETPWGIARVKGGAAGSFATAWVIDTGIDLDHPDLYVDVARAANFVALTTSADDENGHGTHVAGTIAAKAGNGIGVIGVAPGARVVPVRVLDRNGSGTTSGVIAGVEHVAVNGRPGDVANMSLGGSVSTALDQAVIDAAALGVRFVLAAGNESDNAIYHSPARANGTNVFTVSAFSIGDKWASFSNYGAGVDFAEPGVSIKSTWKGGVYNTISGTSMAAPHLAGLLLAGNVNIVKYVIGDPDGKADPIGER
ncbi:MAG: S8 family serine peptidase [Sphingomicrobium sp.]